MPKKGRYKKLVGGWPGKEQKKEETRPKVKAEEKEAAGEGNLPPKKKAKKKRTSRADHKHVYEEVLVQTTDPKTGRHSYEIEGYCKLCGKKDQRFRSYGFWKNDRLWKSTIVHGVRCYSDRTEEEILAICSGMQVIEKTVEKKGEETTG